MYSDEIKKSIKVVESKRNENIDYNPERMTHEQAEVICQIYHPDYRESEFTELKVGANKGSRVPKELGALLEAHSRIVDVEFDLNCADLECDVLIIGGGGAGCSAAIEADNAGAKVILATKLRLGDSNTIMAEGGIQAADKDNDSPADHYIDAFGGGHYTAEPNLVAKMCKKGPEAIA